MNVTPPVNPVDPPPVTFAVKTTVVPTVVGFGATVSVVVVAAIAPVPLSATVCPELLALLSVTVKVAVRVPAAVGVNVTAMEQEFPTPRLDWQLLVWPKSPVLAPLIVIVGAFRAAVPEFCNPTACAVLLVPVV